MLKHATLLLMLLVVAAPASAAGDGYLLNPGDVLEITIWREENMRREVMVLPDGTISYPLAGHLLVAGNTVAEVEQQLVSRLVEGNFYKNPTLTVSVKETSGNQIFVIGEVTKPGVFIGRRQLDVMQALSMAGGLTEFADKDDIMILRREGDKRLTFEFDYSDAQSGKNLSKNIILKSGDTVVVPAGGIF